MKREPVPNRIRKKKKNQDFESLFSTRRVMIDPLEINREVSSEKAV
jgi:hypothetical protein